MDQENEKMITVTLKIPERVGKVLWVMGEDSYAAINGFEDMEPAKQFAYIADVANFINRLKDGMMVGTIAALLDTVSDMVEEAYDEDDEDEGALH
jgi:hypothetical protein